MLRYPPLARVWVALTAFAAVALTLPGLWDPSGVFAPWAALACLAVCAAVAHFFPVKSTADGATYQLTNVFLVAGAVILPPLPLAALVLLALSPHAWGTRRRPGPDIVVVSVG